VVTQVFWRQFRWVTKSFVAKIEDIMIALHVSLNIVNMFLIRFARRDRKRPVRLHLSGRYSYYRMGTVIVQLQRSCTHISLKIATLKTQIKNTLKRI
jgi:hypothetical protein